MCHSELLKKAGAVWIVVFCLGVMIVSAELGRTEPAGQGESKGASAQEKWPAGYTDTPYIPGTKWRVHDIDRPHPKVVTPGTASTPEQPGRPPSDAIVLFDGKDLSKWQTQGKGTEAKWKIENGYMEVVGGTGSIITKENFGDIQLHVEWAAPKRVLEKSQGRGNSGVIFMGRYEIQVLDSYDNLTYADGQASAIYGQYPPLVNPARPPGEWQVYDIVFEAPRFEGDKLVKPAYFTVFFNGVLVHNHTASMGATRHRALAKYEPHPSEGPLLLQNHEGNLVRYRNVWVRRLASYDAQ
jgi:hypothetical protein